MARSPIDLPRMQNQPRLRVAVARAPNLVPQDGEAAPKPRKPRLMRQFELIDRVKQYNPATNEELLKGLEGLTPPESQPEPDVEVGDEEE